MQNIISFSYLYDILRKEKSNKGLSKLKYDLFDDISNYLKLKYEILDKSKEKEQIEEELKSIIDVIKQLYQIRLSKTIDLAKAALDYEHVEDEILKNLSKFEREYFENIVNVFSKQKKWLYDHFREEKVEREVNKESEQIKVETAPKAESQSEEKLIRVKFSKNVPKFMGFDLKSHGPFEKGETADFPQKQVDFLVKKGLVELN